MKTWKRVVSSLLTFLIVLSMFTICTLAAAAQTPGLNIGKLYFNNTENWEQVLACLLMSDGQTSVQATQAQSNESVFYVEIAESVDGVYFYDGNTQRTQTITDFTDGQIFIPDGGTQQENGNIFFSGTLEQYAVKNVIFMIGDGMGSEQIKAGSIYKGETLHMQQMPYSTMVTTYSNSGITDSAAAATALATGYKTANNMVGMLEDGTKVENLVEFSKARGLKTGVIATQVTPHATPAGFTAHVSARYSYNSIAAQQLTQQLDLLFGGGSSYFDTRTEAIEANNYIWIKDLSEIASVPADKNVLGTFSTSYITADDEPHLKDMTAAGLERLSNENGFFTMIEGSDIDSYAHKNDMDKMLKELIVFDDAVEVAQKYVEDHPDTLLIVTADHETGGLKIPDNATTEDLTDNLFTTGNHTGADVPVFASGARAWELCSEPIIDNTEIHDFIADAIEESYGYAPPKDFTNYDARKIFLELPESWEAPFAYTEGAISLGEFPGVEMTHEEDNIYSILLRDYDGNTAPEDLYIPGDVNGNGTVTIQDVLDIQKYLSRLITFNDDAQLAADINCDGSITIEDVLEIQEYLAKEENIYNIGTQVLKPGVAGLSIIFSSQNGYQTEKIPFAGFYKKYTITNNEQTQTATGVWEDYTPTFGSVYFEKPESWENAYFYTWGDAYFGVWPGTKMQQVEDNIYSITISADDVLETTLEFSLVFSDGNTYQTIDIDFAGLNKIYKIFGGENSKKAYGSWFDYDSNSGDDPDPGNPMTIYLKDETSWDITTDDAIISVQCDNGDMIPMTYLGSKIWSATVTDNYKGIVFTRSNPKDGVVWNAFCPATAREENDMYCVTGSTTGYWDKFDGIVEPTDPTDPTDPTEPFDPNQDDSKEFEDVPKKEIYLKDETSWGIHSDDPVIFAQCGSKKIIATPNEDNTVWTASVPQDWDLVIFNRVDRDSGRVWNSFPKTPVSMGENNMYVATSSSEGAWTKYEPAPPGEEREITVYFKNMRGTEYYIPQVMINAEVFDMKLLDNNTDLGTLEASADQTGGWYAYTFTTTQETVNVTFSNSSNKYNMTAEISTDAWFSNKRYDYTKDENLVDYTALHHAIVQAQKEVSPTDTLLDALSEALTVYNSTSYSDKVTVDQDAVNTAEQTLTAILNN